MKSIGIGMVRRVLGYFETVKVGGITVMGMLSIAEYWFEVKDGAN